MNFIKIAVAAMLAFAASSAYAFHSGGVAECEGCHTMHNSSDLFENEHGVAKPQMTTTARGVGNANPYLLQGQDQSSTCLVCHGHSPVGSYHIYSQPAADLAATNALEATATGDEFNFTPGGDFAWLKFDTTHLVRGSAVPGPGERKGHNVVALDYGLALDSRPAAPGGTYAGNGFSCISCHDPHGRYRLTAAGSAVHTTTGLPIRGSGSYGGATNTSFFEPAATYTVGAYRILGGNGYQPKSLTGPVFTADPPIALAPSSYNASESQYVGATGVGQVQVAYGQGMSEWCANCHATMHGGASGTGLTKHPSGATADLGATIAGIYNSYVKSGDTSGGADQYDSIVPFEVGTADRTALRPLANNGNGAGGTFTYVANAATATSQVMCLSCHRAHASAFESMMRWNMDENEFLTSGSTWRSEGTDGLTANLSKAGMYMRSSTQYGSYQRSLCNKCHGKD